MERFQNLTKERAVELHRELWRKIAEILERDDDFKDNDYALKYQALKELYGMTDERPASGCWCCEYTEQRYPEEYGCEKVCPIKWSGYNCDRGGEYEQFKSALWLSNNKDAAKIAREIAELPERKDGDDHDE